MSATAGSYAGTYTTAGTVTYPLPYHSLPYQATWQPVTRDPLEELDWQVEEVCRLAR